MVSLRHRFALAATVILLELTPIAAQAQTQSPFTAPVAYDVMSVRLNKTFSGSTDIDVDDARFSAHNVSLQQLLSDAYTLRPEQISGIPSALESARFDIEAKVVDPDPAALKSLTREQRAAMLLPLLTERFQLQTHTETRTLPVYNLVLTKSGPKFKPSANQQSDDNTSVSGRNSLITIQATTVSLDDFAQILSKRVDRTVINKTGLAGKFDLDLQFSRDTPNPDAGASPDAPPTIFTAIQDQLGLKLEPARGPVQTLVVDHASMPSEN